MTWKITNELNIFVQFYTTGRGIFSKITPKDSTNQTSPPPPTLNGSKRYRIVLVNKLVEAIEERKVCITFEGTWLKNATSKGQIYKKA